MIQRQKEHVVSLHCREQSARRSSSIQASNKAVTGRGHLRKPIKAIAETFRERAVEIED